MKKSILYAGKIYNINDEDLPAEAKKRLNLKEARPAKKVKKEKKEDK